MKSLKLELEQDVAVAAIIGSGFAGLCMGIQLQRSGVSNFVILEKADRVGGVWRDNTYPGAACDVPSFLYSYSFEQRSTWSNRYAEQPEILHYLEDCVRKYDLHRNIKFNTEVVGAKFDQSRGYWIVETQSGQAIKAKILVSGCGQLHHPAIPQIPGLDQFSGTYFHSARWNHQYSLAGKRVAVVGNGASAIQFLPHVADQAAKVTVFQRSPQWIKSKGKLTFSPFEQWLNQTVPFTRELRRLWTYISFEFRFRLLTQGTVASKVFEKTLSQEMLEQLSNPQLKEALLPDYEVGCKRILLSNNYLKTLERSNVDLFSGSIQEIIGDTIITDSGERYPVDAIIFGTGFKSSSFVLPIQIQGIDGKLLETAWDQGAEAYLGMMVAGFPNFFMLYGPNTGLGHSSIVYMIEHQVNYILKMLHLLAQKKVSQIDVNAQAMSTYNQKLQADMRRTVWVGSCSSWYKNEFGKVVNNWPGFTWQYALQTRKVKLADLELR